MLIARSVPEDSDPLVPRVALERGPLGPLHDDDPALALMTDLRVVEPRLVGDDVQIDAALQHMREQGVRLLFVVDASRRLVGVVSSYDIQGEKPIRHLQSRDCTLRTCSRADVLTRHVMEPLAELRVVDLEDVRNARVADVEAALLAEGRTHLPVIERLAEGRMTIRGLFSATELARRLGRGVGVVPRARSFADIERVVAGGAAL